MLINFVGAATDFAIVLEDLINNFGIIFVFLIAMVFFFILPQRKKDKKVREMLSNLKRGDRITTIGGIFGKVTDLTEKTVTIEVGSEKVTIIMARWAVRDVENNEVVNDTAKT